MFRSYIINSAMDGYKITFGPDITGTGFTVRVSKGEHISIRRVTITVWELYAEPNERDEFLINLIEDIKKDI